MIDFIGLDLLELHDAPVKNINIQLEPLAQLFIEVEIWEEDLNEYSHTELHFKQLSHIYPEKVEIENNSELEIHGFEYHLKDGEFIGKMTFLTGVGKPSLDIQFSCRAVEIVNH